MRARASRWVPHPGIVGLEAAFAFRERPPACVGPAPRAAPAPRLASLSL